MESFALSGNYWDPLEVPRSTWTALKSSGSLYSHERALEVWPQWALCPHHVISECLHPVSQSSSTWYLPVLRVHILESYNLGPIVGKAFPDRENTGHKEPRGIKGRGSFQAENSICVKSVDRFWETVTSCHTFWKKTVDSCMSVTFSVCLIEAGIVLCRC